MPHEVGRGLAPLSPWLSPLSPWLGLGFVGALMPSLWRSREWLASTIASIGCVAIWINSTADQRYLIAAIGLLAISGGLVAERAVWWVAARLRAPVRKRWLAPVGAVALPFVVIAGWPSALYVERFVRHNWPPPTSGATVSAYLTARMPCYPGVDYLNRRLGSGYSAYAWGCEQTRYYAKGEYVGDVFSRGSYGRVFLNDGRAMPSDDVLASRLRDLGVQYLIVPTARLGDPGPLLQRGRFQLVYDREQTYVFRLG